MASAKLADIREFIKPVYFEGLEKGKLEGKLEGLSEGETKKAIETARLMKEYGDSIDKISKITGLTPSQLKEIGIIKIPLFDRLASSIRRLAVWGMGYFFFFGVWLVILILTNSS